MSETMFIKIKRIVEQEKEKKVRGEARISQLGEERKRIFAQLQEETGQNITSLEAAEKYSDKLRESIEDDVQSMEQILKEEGFLL